MSVVEPRPIGPDSPGGGRLPSGRHRLSREFVVSSQRDRLLQAMAHLCAEKGLPAVTVRDIVDRAQVSRTTFYELFEDKEAYLLGANEAFVERFLIAFSGGAGREEVPWIDGVREGLGLLLSFFAAEPAFARMCIVDMLVAGPRALARDMVAVRLVTGYVDRGRPQLEGREALPASVADAVVGGVGAVIRNEVLNGRTEHLPELLPDLLYLALSFFLDLDGALSRRDAGRRSTQG
jgi:AcrR family transcriptional regulator